MKTIFSNKISLFLFLFFSVCFFMNMNHFAQQGIYDNWYVPLADNLYNNLFYSIDGFNFNTYPIWGYSIILFLLKLLHLDYSHVLYIQYLFVVYSFIVVFKEVDYIKTEKKYLFLIVIIFFFYVAMLSVKWPDAFLVFFLFLAAKHHMKREYVKAALFIGIAYNFRTEMLAVLIVYTFLIFHISRSKKIFLSILLLLPYIATNFYFNKSFIPTTTNAGGVLYITLGQLPNNIWNRTHNDGEARKYVISKTNNEYINPWGIEGNSYLKEAFINDIKEHPLEFIKKSFYNLFSILKGGLYSYEYHSIFWSRDKHKEFKNKYKGNGSLLVNDFLKFKKDVLIYSLTIFINILSRVILLILFFNLLKCFSKENIILYLFVLFQILLCMLVQYEPRHMSKILGISLIVLLYSNLIKLKSENVSSI